MTEASRLGARGSVTFGGSGHWDPVSGDIVFREMVSMEVEFQCRMQEAFTQYEEPASARNMLELSTIFRYYTWFKSGGSCILMKAPTLGARWSVTVPTCFMAVYAPFSNQKLERFHGTI